MLRSPYLLLFAVLLTIGACRTPQGSLTWTGNAPPPGTDDTTTPPPTPPPGRNIETLAVIDQRPWPAAELPPELSGENKPGDAALRFRRHVPDDAPRVVARTRDGLDLFIADPVENQGWLAFYKGDCGALGDVCRYRAVLYDAEGLERWDIDLNRFLQNDRYVEIQDIRYQDGKLYFNEACATYAREAGGQCSWLVRLDPVWQEVDWRTPPLTSNNIFILHAGYVIAGYGFTAEPDAVYLIDQRTGRIRARADLDTAHSYLEVQDNRLYVVTYNSLYTFAL